MPKLVQHLVPTLGAFAPSSSVALAQDALPQQDDRWFSDARSALEERLAYQPNTNRAKNVILMIADGNGVGTNYATRLFHGQQNGGYGDENVLPHEALPHLALVKTYNTNAQTPDSSGTATAMFSGVKTKEGVVGVDETVERGNCAQVEAGKATPLTRLMADAGKAVGVVTTARLTHATPASAYAHAADRDFEDDSALPEGCERCRTSPRSCSRRCSRAWSTSRWAADGVTSCPRTWRVPRGTRGGVPTGATSSRRPRQPAPSTPSTTRASRRST